jgi:hypothetical protein
MTNARKNDVGADNAKVPDTTIQGERGGKRNRKSQDGMPPPAGEVRPEGADPREAQLRPANPSSRQTSRSS